MADLWGGGGDCVASHPHFGEGKREKKMKKLSILWQKLNQSFWAGTSF